MEEEVASYFQKILTQYKCIDYKELFNIFLSENKSEIVNQFKGYSYEQKYRLFDKSVNHFFTYRNYVFLKTIEIKKIVYQRLYGAVAFLLNCYEPLNYIELERCIYHALPDIVKEVKSFSKEERKNLFTSIPFTKEDKVDYFMLIGDYEQFESPHITREEKTLLCIVGALLFYKILHFEKLVKEVKNRMPERERISLCKTSVSEQYKYMKNQSPFINMTSDGFVSPPSSFIFPKCNYRRSAMPSKSKLENVETTSSNPIPKGDIICTNYDPLNMTHQKICRRIESGTAFLLNYFKLLSKRLIVTLLLHIFEDVDVCLCNLPPLDQCHLLKNCFKHFGHGIGGEISIKTFCDTHHLNVEEKDSLFIAYVLNSFGEMHYRKVFDKFVEYERALPDCASDSGEFRYFREKPRLYRIHGNGYVSLATMPTIGWHLSDFLETSAFFISESSVVRQSKMSDKEENVILNVTEASPSYLPKTKEYPQRISSPDIIKDIENPTHRKVMRRMKNGMTCILKYCKLSTKKKVLQLTLHVLADIHSYLDTLQTSDLSDFLKNCFSSFLSDEKGRISLNAPIETCDLSIEEKDSLFFVYVLGVSGITHYRKLFVEFVEHQRQLPDCIHSDSDKFHYFKIRSHLYSTHQNGNVSLTTLPVIKCNLSACPENSKPISTEPAILQKDSLESSTSSSNSNVVVENVNKEMECSNKQTITEKPDNTQSMNSMLENNTTDILFNGERCIDFNICKRLKSGVTFLSKYFDLSCSAHFIKVVIQVFADLNVYFNKLFISSENSLILKYNSFCSSELKRLSKSTAFTETSDLSSSEKVSLLVAYVLSQNGQMHYQKLFKLVHYNIDGLDYLQSDSDLFGYFKKCVHLFRVENNGMVASNSLSQSAVSPDKTPNFEYNEYKKLCCAILFLLECFDVLHCSELRACICYVVKDVELYLLGFSEETTTALFKSIPFTKVDGDFLKIVEPNESVISPLNRHEKVLLFVACHLGFCITVHFEDLVKEFKSRTSKNVSDFLSNLTTDDQLKYLKGLHPYVNMLENCWLVMPKDFTFPITKYRNEKEILQHSKQRSKSVTSLSCGNNQISSNRRNSLTKEINYLNLVTNLFEPNESNLENSSEEIREKLSSSFECLMKYFSLSANPKLLSVIFLALHDLRMNFFILSAANQLRIIKDIFRPYQINEYGKISSSYSVICNNLSEEQETILLIVFMTFLDEKIHYKIAFDKLFNLKGRLPNGIHSDPDKFWYLLQRDHIFFSRPNGYFKLQTLPDVSFNWCALVKKYPITEKAMSRIACSVDRIVDVKCQNFEIGKETEFENELNSTHFKTNDYKNLTKNSFPSENNLQKSMSADQMFNFFEKIRNGVRYIFNIHKFFITPHLFQVLIYAFGDCKELFSKLSFSDQSLALKMCLLCNEEIETDGGSKAGNLTYSDKVLLSVISLVDDKNRLRYNDLHAQLKCIQLTSNYLMLAEDLRAYIQRRETIFALDSDGYVTLHKLPEINLSDVGNSINMFTNGLLNTSQMPHGNPYDNTWILSTVKTLMKKNVGLNYNLVNDAVAAQIRSSVIYLFECYDQIIIPHILNLVFLVFSETQKYFITLPPAEKCDLVAKVLQPLKYDEKGKIILKSKSVLSKYNLSNEEKDLLFITYALAVSGECRISKLIQTFSEYGKPLPTGIIWHKSIFSVIDNEHIKLVSLSSIGLNSRLFCNYFSLPTKDTKSGLKKFDSGSQPSNFSSKSEPRVLSNFSSNDKKCDENVSNLNTGGKTYENTFKKGNTSDVDDPPRNKINAGKSILTSELCGKVENGMLYLSECFGYIVKVNSSLVSLTIHCLDDVKKEFSSLSTIDQFSLVNNLLSNSLIINRKLVSPNSTTSLSVEEKLLLFSAYLLSFSVKMLPAQIFNKFVELNKAKTKHLTCQEQIFYFKRKADIFSVDKVTCVRLNPQFVDNIQRNYSSRDNSAISSTVGNSVPLQPKRNLDVVKRMIIPILNKNKSTRINTNASPNLAFQKAEGIIKSIHEQKDVVGQTELKSSKDFNQFFKRITGGLEYFMALNIEPTTKLLQIIVHVLPDVRNIFMHFSESDKTTFRYECQKICHPIRKMVFSHQGVLSKREKELLTVAYILGQKVILHYRKVFLEVEKLNKTIKFVLSDKEQFWYFKNKQSIFSINSAGFSKLIKLPSFDFEINNNLEHCLSVQIERKDKIIELNPSKVQSSVKTVVNKINFGTNEVCRDSVKERIRLSAIHLCKFYNFITEKLITQSVVHVLEDVKSLFIPSADANTEAKESKQSLSGEEKVLLLLTCLLLRSEPYHYRRLFQKIKALDVTFIDSVVTDTDRFDYFKKKDKWFVINSDGNVFLKKSILFQYLNSDHSNRCSPVANFKGSKLNESENYSTTSNFKSYPPDRVFQEITLICSDVLHNISKDSETVNTQKTDSLLISNRNSHSDTSKSVVKDNVFSPTTGVLENYPNNKTINFNDNKETSSNMSENVTSTDEISSSKGHVKDVVKGTQNKDSVCDDGISDCQSFQRLDSKSETNKNQSDEHSPSYSRIKIPPLSQMCEKSDLSETIQKEKLESNSDCDTLISYFLKYLDIDSTESKSTQDQILHQIVNEFVSENKLFLNKSAVAIAERRTVHFFMVVLGSCNGVGQQFLITKLQLASKEVQDYIKCNYPTSLVPFFLKYRDIFFVSRFSKSIYLKNLIKR